MCVRLTLTALIALIAFGPGVSAQGSYPEPPKATRTFPITGPDRRASANHFKPPERFPETKRRRLHIVPDGDDRTGRAGTGDGRGRKVLCLMEQERRPIWGVDCVTQKVVQILGTTPVDLSCSHWAALADKEVEVYFFYRL
jgi:hypothetical protein